MKALVFEEPQSAAICDVDMPKIASDEVLVRSRNVGICHSDFELYEGRYIIPVSYPIIPGHEWAGEVAVPGVLHSPAGWCFAEVLLGRPVVAEHDGEIQAGGVHGSELRRTVLVEVGGQDVLADHLRADAREDGRAEAGHSLPPRLAVPGFLDDVAVRVDPHGFERLTTG